MNHLGDLGLIGIFLVLFFKFGIPSLLKFVKDLPRGGATGLTDDQRRLLALEIGQTLSSTMREFLPEIRDLEKKQTESIQDLAVMLREFVLELQVFNEKLFGLSACNSSELHDIRDHLLKVKALS